MVPVPPPAPNPTTARRGLSTTGSRRPITDRPRGLRGPRPPPRSRDSRLNEPNVNPPHLCPPPVLFFGEAAAAGTRPPPHL